MEEGKDQPVQVKEALEFNDQGKIIGLMQRMTKPIWYAGGILSLWDKCVFGFALVPPFAKNMEEQQQQSMNILKENEGAITPHFADKNIADVVVLQKETTNGAKWHIFCMKEPYHIRQIISTFGTIEEVEGANTKRQYTKEEGKAETIKFRHREPFANHFKYKDVVMDHTKLRLSPIEIEKTWKTNYWPDRNFAWFLAITEANTLLPRTYFGSHDTDGSNKQESSQLEFVGHELVMAPPYTG
eukprot:13941763-Ditylum_brightwellii.AAC.1